MSVLLVLAFTLQAGGGDAAMQAYREKTRAIIPCKTTGDPDEVTICALREADKKYRVPFVSVRAADNVPAQTERVLEDVMFQCGVSGPFLLILPLLLASLQAASEDDLTFALNGDGTEYSVSGCRGRFPLGR